MTSTAATPDALDLQPLPYQLALRDYLRDNEREIWNWYAAHSVSPEHAEATRLDLLKSTYRIERESQPELYSAAEEVARKLRLDAPITIYQAQNAVTPNASVALLPSEAHIILQGAVASKLTPTEMQALLAHELGHLVLWRVENAELLMVDQILAALLHDAAHSGSHRASARLFWLYNEISCDRAALEAVGDPLVVISMLMKIETDSAAVSAESYLRQAQEIFARGTQRTAETTHPEAFIRARAVQLWHDKDPQANSEIERMIEGPLSLGTLDLMRQKKVHEMTRSLIDAFLVEPWMRTERVLSHARLFFDDYQPPAPGAKQRKDPESIETALAGQLAGADKSIHDYVSFVLLDFVTIDQDLEELPLTWALSLCESLGIKEQFSDIARSELSLKKKQFEKLEAAKEEMLAKARTEGQRSP
jgi:Zn-dependent protease with chaperone function